MKEDYKNRGLDLKRLTLYFQKKIWIMQLEELFDEAMGQIGLMPENLQNIGIFMGTTCEKILPKESIIQRHI